ncbi:PIGX protein, partial [Crypturellus soui]|nr:PIGX protein [Crypturellus soui]
VLGAQAVCQDAVVTQQLLQEGFHRELLLQVELGVTREDLGRCTVAARTRLPSGIYVDPYELASLQRHNLTKALVIPDAVDVEAPEYLAPELVVFLYMTPDPRCSGCFTATLPVHGRYHRPAENNGTALVTLKGPEILICCCDNHLSTECWKPSDVEAACLERSNYPCQWYSVKHKLVNEELIMQIPVGLRQHRFMVCVTTLLATVLCSSMILAAACKYGHSS